MGESACLMRSFSHPSDASRELREGDPVSALTESVSFGRFMSESLAWEKWSAFSHNRYLEEAEKFAKPGSVAAKKAYFEAHYRKKAALREASQVEEASLGAADVESPTTESESAEPENHTKCYERQEEESSGNSVDVSVGSTDVESPSVESESIDLENHIKCEERPEEDCSGSVDVSLGSTDVTLEESKPEDVVVTSSGSVEQGPAVAEDDNSTQMPKSDECIETKTPESDTNKEAADTQTTVPIGGKKRLISVPKPLNQIKASKPLLPRAKGTKPTEQRIGKDSGPGREKSVDERKKPAPKSIHMSINFAASNMPTSKKLSPVLQQIRKLRDITASLKSQQDSSIARKFPTRASFNATSKVTPITAKSEETRDRIHKSVAGRLVTEKSSNSLSKENSKSSFTNGSKGQCPVACSPFRFRSEERAAKRKEKQEEKAKATEAEKVKPREGFRSPTASKLGKTSTQDMRLGTKPRHSHQTSANVESTNHIKGKRNAVTSAAIPSSRSRNKVRENSSPNIPQ